MCDKTCYLRYTDAQPLSNVYVSLAWFYLDTRCHTLFNQQYPWVFHLLQFCMHLGEFYDIEIQMYQMT